MRPKHTQIETFERGMELLPLVARCLFCEWEWEGAVLEGRERALNHRLEIHPELKPKRRRPGRHLKSFRQVRLNAEDLSDINAERMKRARLVGIELID
jgi:hypothetical protein